MKSQSAIRRLIVFCCIVILGGCDAVDSNRQTEYSDLGSSGVTDGQRPIGYRPSQSWYWNATPKIVYTGAGNEWIRNYEGEYVNTLTGVASVLNMTLEELVLTVGTASLSMSVSFDDYKWKEAVIVRNNTLNITPTYMANTKLNPNGRSFRYGSINFYALGGGEFHVSLIGKKGGQVMIVPTVNNPGPQDCQADGTLETTTYYWSNDIEKTVDVGPFNQGDRVKVRAVVQFGEPAFFPDGKCFLHDQPPHTQSERIYVDSEDYSLFKSSGDAAFTVNGIAYTNGAFVPHSSSGWWIESEGIMFDEYWRSGEDYIGDYWSHETSDFLFISTEHGADHDFVIVRTDGKVAWFTLDG